MKGIKAVTPKTNHRCQDATDCAKLIGIMKGKVQVIGEIVSTKIKWQGTCDRRILKSKLIPFAK